MRYTSAFLLSVLPLVTDVFAVPAPQSEPSGFPALPAGSIVCPVISPGAECYRGADGNQTRLAGYVSADWYTDGTNPTPRSLHDRAAETDYASSNIPNPEPIYSADILFDAVSLLNPEAFKGVTAVYLNRLDWNTRGQFPLGIGGTFEQDTTIYVPQTALTTNQTITFFAQSQWSMRYDFAWADRPPFNDSCTIRGPNIQVDIQQYNNPSQNVSIAFYPENDSHFDTAAFQGNYYYQWVLMPLRTLAAFNNATQTFKVSQIAGAKAIANNWSQYYSSKKGGAVTTSY